jgi:hypothetical protein
MPDSQSPARLPCPIHDDDSGRRRAENSATRWSRCSAQRVDHNRCYRRNLLLHTVIQLFVLSVLPEFCVQYVQDLPTRTLTQRPPV